MKWSIKIVRGGNNLMLEFSFLTYSVATLKDDDAEDSADEADVEGHEVLVRESKVLRTEQRSIEKQPTGRVVGIIKRNWRA